MIVQSPPLPSGNYAVLASLNVSNGGLWRGPRFVGPPPIAPASTTPMACRLKHPMSQELTINDIWRVSTAQDRIDLVCNGTATANNATITALPLANVTQTTTSGPASQ